MEDPFYEILCERVDVALREKGIDPIRDRGAPCLRVVYYFVVLVSVLLAAVAHIKVSNQRSITNCHTRLFQLIDDDIFKFCALTGQYSWIFYLSNFWMVNGSLGS
jgi:hypothetical protein